MGSGIIGTAVAWQLQAHGADAVLVGDAEPRGASYFSFASLSRFDEPLSEVYALKGLGMSNWRKSERELGDIGLRRDGEIRWAETPEAAQTLDEKIARASKRGSSARAISRDELARRLPFSKPAQVLAASFEPEDGQANPRMAVAKLRETFVDAGGTLLVGHASLRFDGDTILIRVGEHEVEASSVVVAGGAETEGLLEKLGWQALMRPSPGLLAVTEPTAPVLTGTVYGSPVDGPAIHLRQLPDGRVVIGERSQEYAASQPTMSHALDFFRQAQKSFPILSATRVDKFTLEWRPMPRDGMPIVSPLPGFPAIYVATSHTGVTLAPAIAELVARELVDGEAAELSAFRPARFAGGQTFLAREVETAFN